ncbi:unnamed protein product [Knipowitschia caucasica]|uniref:Uncharacterized protein n=1 Tax=Knipowitschia caucasica TaxID=637954 RepID=A0AAV2LQ95_KNICA
MAAASSSLCEEKFLCSVCLEVFTDPVTTLCGHSFCSICITKHWDNIDHCICPVCKQDFSSRPQLKVNSILASKISMFRNMPQDEETVMEALSTAPGERICDLYATPGEVVCDLYAAPGEVVCDLCSVPRLRAVKSCLVCLMSYCESHLRPHLTNPRLKRHQLIQPLPDLEEHICSEQGWPLELFCRDHSHFMCERCSYTEETKHNTDLLKEQGEEQRATLKKQIQERRVKVQEIQRSVKQSQRKAEAEIQEGLRVFYNLMECVEQSADSFKQSIVEKHRKTKKEAAQLIEQIQREICELEQRGAEMEQLWSSGHHLHFVQTFTTVKPAPQLNDWSRKTVRIPSYKGTGAQAVSELRKELNTEMETFFKAELEIVQEFAAKLYLDPNTANPQLIVSKDRRQVHDCGQRQNLSDNPERFTSIRCVLGKQKFSSGKFYFEVAVKGKRFWEVGVAKESVDRADKGTQTVQKGYWTLCFSGHYQTSDVPSVVFSVQSRPEKVGVFVDYDEGLVSFYDVDEESLLYSFTDCCFTDNILPLFIPFGSTPLVLTPVGV